MDAMFQGWYHGKKAHEADLDQVLLRSRRANVTHQIVTAGNLKESRHGVEFVAKHGTFLLSTVLVGAFHQGKGACVWIGVNGNSMF